MTKKRVAIGLFSGGLDSTIACKLIRDLGFHVIALHFSSPFCRCAGSSGCGVNYQKLADELSVELVHKAFGKEYIEMVKNPKFGYGKNMNPCIDCRIMYLKGAKQLMEERNALFVFTGEVLGQRPKSQRLHALKIVEKHSGLEGYLLRPLSARLLPETEVEKKGIVPREKLLAIKGRSRKVQLSFAEKFQLEGFACPAGGCLLTDENFARRLKDLFSHNMDSLRNINLLKIGRHFRLSERVKFITGRKEKENNILTSLAYDTEYLIEPELPAPTGLFIGTPDEKTIQLGCNIVTRYSRQKRMNLKVYKKDGSFEKVYKGEALPHKIVEQYFI